MLNILIVFKIFYNFFNDILFPNNIIKMKNIVMVSIWIKFEVLKNIYNLLIEYWHWIFNIYKFYSFYPDSSQFLMLIISINFGFII